MRQQKESVINKNIKNGYAIDIVMPVYNAACYLKDSIESILQQTFSDFRFIIVDDGSTDTSRSILQKYAAKDNRIILIKNTMNSGICISLNKAIAAGSANYIVRMDADDISHIDRVATQIEFMEQHPEIGVAGCNVRCIDEHSKANDIKYYANDDKEIRKQLFLFNPICHPAAILRRSIFEKTIGYDHRYILAEDLALRFAMGLYADFANIPQTLLDYRVYANNSTSKKLQSMASQAIKARLNALQKQGYKTGILGRLAIGVSFVIQFLPSKFGHRLFYKLRKLVV